MKHAIYHNEKEEMTHLREQFLQEVDAYVAKENREYLYVPKIIERHPDFLERPVEEERALEDVGLHVRPYTCLKKAGVKTLGEVLALSIEDMLEIPGLGQKSVSEILALQDAVQRGRAFCGSDKNVFELGMSTASIQILMRHGYFFWDGIEKDLDKIEKILREAGLEAQLFENEEERYEYEYDHKEEPDEYEYDYGEGDDYMWEIPEITEFSYIQRAPYFKEKVEEVYALWEEGKGEIACQICVALMEAIGSVVVEKEFGGKLERGSLVEIVAELIHYEEHRLADLFVSLNGDLNVIDEYGEDELTSFLYDLDFMLNVIEEEHECIVEYIFGEAFDENIKNSTEELIRFIKDWDAMKNNKNEL